MRKFLVVNFAIVLVLSITFSNSKAQGLGFKGVGGRLSFVDPESPIGSTIGFGGHVHLGEIITNLALYPSLEYWSKSDVSSFVINGNVRYYFPTSGNIDLFGGGGLAISFVNIETASGDNNTTDIGLNLLGGADFPIGENLVATAKLTFLISDIDVLKITGGITYLLRK
ncbi:MAG: outer membrane beta-barrel protein [bacterium]